MDKSKLDEFLKRAGLPPVEEVVRGSFKYAYRRQGDSEERVITGQIVGYDVTYQTISIISPALSSLNVCVFCLAPGFAQKCTKWYFSPGGSEAPKVRSTYELDAIKMITGRLEFSKKEVILS